jgi:hypothetical protein
MLMFLQIPHIRNIVLDLKEIPLSNFFLIFLVPTLAIYIYQSIGFLGLHFITEL